MRGTWALGAADFSPLTILLVAVVATLGALVIHAISRRRGTAEAHIATPASPRAAPVADGEIDLPELRDAMREAAARMDLPERLLPLLALPSGADGDFVYRENGEYVYCAVERGARLAEHRTADLDDFLFHVFRDKAWTRTYTGLIGQDLTPQEHAELLAQGQRVLLEKAEPRWAARLAAEQG